MDAPALGVEERRPTPDPVAKPKSRASSPRVSTADSGRELEVGRLLRREGLYSSHLTVAQGAVRGRFKA